MKALIPFTLPFAFAALALLPAGCTETLRQSPVDVTRYHLGNPIAPTTVSIEPQIGGISPEFNAYADAVRAELARAGFAAPAEGSESALIASVDFKRTPRGDYKTRPPVTIGLGGASYGRNVGVGGDVGFGIGSKHVEIYANELTVRLRRRSDSTVIWDGHALSEGPIAAKGPDTIPQRLAAALFKGFPGESGVTITVK